MTLHLHMHMQWSIAAAALTSWLVCTHLYPCRQGHMCLQVHVQWSLAAAALTYVLVLHQPAPLQTRILMRWTTTGSFAP
jgi:hypothetical protein